MHQPGAGPPAKAEGPEQPGLPTTRPAAQLAAMLRPHTHPRGSGGHCSTGMLGGDHGCQAGPPPAFWGVTAGPPKAVGRALWAPRGCQGYPGDVAGGTLGMTGRVPRAAGDDTPGLPRRKPGAVGGHTGAVGGILGLLGGTLPLLGGAHWGCWRVPGLLGVMLRLLGGAHRDCWGYWGCWGTHCGCRGGTPGLLGGTGAVGGHTTAVGGAPRACREGCGAVGVAPGLRVRGPGLPGGVGTPRGGARRRCRGCRGRDGGAAAPGCHFIAPPLRPSIFSPAAGGAGPVPAAGPAPAAPSM